MVPADDVARLSGRASFLCVERACRREDSTRALGARRRNALCQHAPVGEGREEGTEMEYEKRNVPQAGQRCGQQRQNC